jgi:spermidine/putrescine transport system permease protein
MRRRIFAYPYVVWMALFIFSPMLLILYHAFVSGGAFTWNNIRNAFDPLYMQVLGRSIFMGVKATLVCLLIGYPVAYLLSRMKKSTAAMLSILFILPMWMNFLLRTYAWQVILDTQGILNTILSAVGLPILNMLYTESAVLLGMVYNFLPFMILPIYTTLQKLDRGLMEAGSDLGANGTQAFLRVMLPLSMPGVVSGITMVFIPSITTFAISKLLGGGMFMMYGDLIETQYLMSNDWGGGSALSVILLVLVVVSMVIMRRAESAAGNEEEAKLW